jgi:SagB-type dehydrogenase family enzyme
MEADPQILLVVTSRFGRVSWKYQAIAYALTLKAVGALYQTMYLTATAMGLAPCAIGTGDGALMARLLGTDFADESSVGEFLLGTDAS